MMFEEWVKREEKACKGVLVGKIRGAKD